ncbi:hypothetical protein CC_1174 [Caulobacter vibrioides CB15]|uniref:Uncharacterized protein n=1 Tax=Caulobacter vibrioides (strain ATCC 19089 / CIP 103742 / CB 15) TaxID=190650 RepID=Q9A920_CAUVC|nr:hypothetical protein CC_1174 [Caulobacter vibrioides CB15]
MSVSAPCSAPSAERSVHCVGLFGLPQALVVVHAVRLEAQRRPGPDVQLPREARLAVMLDGVHLGRQGHGLKGGEGRVLGQSDRVPHLLNLAQKQAGDRATVANAPPQGLDQTRDDGAVAGVGLAAGKLGFRAVRILGLLFELQEIDHDERTIVRRAEKLLELLGAGKDCVDDLHRNAPG